MINKFVGLTICALVLVGAATAKSIIYGAAYAGPNAPAVLYKISPKDGSATAIGPIGVNTVSALDFAPNGTLYGVGITNSLTFVLLTINTTTGAGTQIGPIGLTGPLFGPFQDIAFRPSDGTLFGYSGPHNGPGSTGQIYTINTTTGAATLVGSTGVPFNNGNGLAFSSAKVLYNAWSAFDGTVFTSFLQTIDQGTGAATTLIPLTYSATFGDPTVTIPRPNGMKFDAAGTLWASIAVAIPGVSYFGTIDPATGFVNFVGQTVAGLDAIAIGQFTDTAFQVSYASNLNIGDSVVNITNTGASATSNGARGFNGGNLCINAYVFDQSEELLACCSCFVTPNGLSSFSVKNQLVSNNLTPEIPNSVVIKLLSTTGPVATTGAIGGVNGCNAGGTITSAMLAPGMKAWGTTLHALPATPVKYGLTESEFSTSDLSQGELNHLTSFCGFIQSNGSGFGICKGCSVGGLGATLQK